VKTATVPADTARCSVHLSRLISCRGTNPQWYELHHVIPQAWQFAWPADGRTVIWDRRTMPLCRTGHGNVHYWIVRLMREVRDGTLHQQPLRRVNLTRRTKEFAIARLALTRFTEAGGDLTALAKAGRMGGMFGSGG